MRSQVQFKVVDGLTAEGVLEQAVGDLSSGWRFLGPLVVSHVVGRDSRFNQVLVKAPQRYLILKDATPDALQREVNLAIESGFVPHGPLVIEKFNGQPLFIQAMCLAPLSL